ncbi:cell division protein FtsQ/DivIB [Profundibacter sp.]
MQQVEPTIIAPRRDPAPSRISYKIQRLMLRSGFRRFLHVGLPVLVLTATVGIVFSDAGRREAFELKISEVRRSIQERPEFMVKLMAIDGASDAVAAEIRQSLPLEFPMTAFDLDLEQMRAGIAKMDIVANVDVLVRSGVLQINVVERIPAVVWRSYEGVILLDAEGHRVKSVVDRAMHPELPLIAGQGADKHIVQALDILAATGPLAVRVRGIEWMGERRWDLVLDRKQRILLPEDAPIAALERVIALSKAQDMLARDLTIIDMRNGHRPTIRIAEGAIAELRRIRALK